MTAFGRVIVVALLLFPLSLSHAYSRAFSAKAIFQRSHSSIVVIEKYDVFGHEGRGTGFFVAPNEIATNYHVVQNALTLKVHSLDKETKYTYVKVLASNPSADIAIIRVKGRSPHYLHLDAHHHVEVGDPIFVIGNPMGFSGTLSEGIISGIRKHGSSVWYQLTASVAHGSSGSPVLDPAGNVIGIVFGRLRHEAEIGFASPATSLVDLGKTQKLASNALAIRAPSSHSLSSHVELDDLPIYGRNGVSHKNAINIGVPSWDSGITIAYVLKATIEKFFKYTVNLIPASNKDIFSGMVEGDGSFDIHPDVWLPNYRRFLRKGINLNRLSYVGEQGDCVPRYMRRRYGVSNLRDLANTNVAQLFDTNKDGKGNIWIGEQGWQSTKIQRLKARDFGYEHTFDLDTYSENDLYKRLATAYSARKPFVFYCYGPHWLLRKYDLVFLRQPPHAKDCFHLANGETGNAWYQDSYASCRGPVTTVHLAYSDRLAKKHPRLAGFLYNLSFNYEDLCDLIYRMIGNRAHKSRVARLWVNRNFAALQNVMTEAAKR